MRKRPKWQKWQLPHWHMANYHPDSPVNKPIIIDVAHCIYLILLANGFTRVRRIKLLCVKTINYAANKNSARNNNKTDVNSWLPTDSETNCSLWKSRCRLTKVGNNMHFFLQHTCHIYWKGIKIARRLQDINPYWGSQHCWCNI